MSKYLRSRSMPKNCFPWLAQATPVVPLPMKGSQTVCAPSAKLMLHSITRTGFCVGCPTRSEFVALIECFSCFAFMSRLVHASSKFAMLGGESGLNHESHPLLGGSW